MPASSETPDLPSRRRRLLLPLLARLPQGALSRAFGRMADLPIPQQMRSAVLGTFARTVGVDLDEVELPLDRYGTLNEFFVRRLRPRARQWPGDPTVLASPVDGATGQVGRISGGRVLQAKGRWYSVAELVGDDTEAARFEGGSFATLYLSPRDYHRIHSPCDGQIPYARHIPGALLPVNAPSVAHVPDLFPRNERLLCAVDGPLGRVMVVAVGAYNVGRISAAFDPEWRAGEGERQWVTNRRGGEPARHDYSPAVPIRQGEELMAFHLGSTVVVLLEPGRCELDPSLAPERPVRLGMVLGRRGEGERA
jgi:phosphatidylserine decarboxylase